MGNIPNRAPELVAVSIPLLEQLRNTSRDGLVLTEGKGLFYFHLLGGCVAVTASLCSDTPSEGVWLGRCLHGHGFGLVHSIHDSSH